MPRAGPTVLIHGMYRLRSIPGIAGSDQADYPVPCWAAYSTGIRWVGLWYLCIVMLAVLKNRNPRLLPDFAVDDKHHSLSGKHGCGTGANENSPSTPSIAPILLRRMDVRRWKGRMNMGPSQRLQKNHATWVKSPSQDGDSQMHRLGEPQGPLRY